MRRVPDETDAVMVIDRNVNGASESKAGLVRAITPCISFRWSMVEGGVSELSDVAAGLLKVPLGPSAIVNVGCTKVSCSSSRRLCASAVHRTERVTLPTDKMSL